MVVTLQAMGLDGTFIVIYFNKGWFFLKKINVISLAVTTEREKKKKKEREKIAIPFTVWRQNKESDLSRPVWHLS